MLCHNINVTIHRFSFARVSMRRCPKLLARSMGSISCSSTYLFDSKKFEFSSKCMHDLKRASVCFAVQLKQTNGLGSLHLFRPDSCGRTLKCTIYCKSNISYSKQ